GYVYGFPKSLSVLRYLLFITTWLRSNPLDDMFTFMLPLSDLDLTTTRANPLKAWRCFEVNAVMSQGLPLSVAIISPGPSMAHSIKLLAVGTVNPFLSVIFTVMNDKSFPFE